jgi:hypothetical protein
MENIKVEKEGSKDDERWKRCYSMIEFKDMREMK